MTVLTLLIWKRSRSDNSFFFPIEGVKELETRSIGWAGVNEPDDAGQRAFYMALVEMRCIPVFLAKQMVNQYYNRHCNILWPLFHYLGLPEEDRLAATCSFQSQFNGFKNVNQLFDVSKCFKACDNRMQAAWFPYKPFSSIEIHRTQPSRTEVFWKCLYSHYWT